MKGFRPLTGKGELTHPELGTIRYTVRRTARRFLARWRGGVLLLTVPSGATAADTAKAIESMKSRLLVRKPNENLYEFDREMKFELLTVTVRAVDGYGARCTLHNLSSGRFEIRLDCGADLGASQCIEAVSRLMKSVARYLAPQALMPRAAELAAAVGARPTGWKLTSGKKVLGRCNSRGEISLSSVLVFLPSDLRDYVVMHELAHLREMNHSERFHAVCDMYCGGRERELERRLKDFRFPLV